MQAPIGLVAAALLVWGIYCELWFIALPIALVIEAARFSTLRWEITAKDFQRVADFCTWLFLLEAGYFIVAKGWPLPILQILQWLPLVLAPLVIAQCYSSARRIELSALFLSLRAAHAGPMALRRVDLSYAYVVTCLVSAGTANNRSSWFYPLCAAIAVWALWQARSPAYTKRVWVALIALALGLGYYGHHGLSRLQTWVFNAAIEYLQLDLVRTDPYRALTDIGHVGELKMSERIVMRVEASDNMRSPILLRRAAYDVFTGSTWIAKDGHFNDAPASDALGQWRLPTNAPVEQWIRVSERFASGIGILALPAGTVMIEGLANAQVQRNRFGTMRVERVPGLVSYRMAVAAGVDALDAPEPADIRVPAQAAQAVAAVIDELKLSATMPDKVPEVLRAYFREHFRYSTYRAQRVERSVAVSEFLQTSRSGHCEYFATATVLLARAAGIPARYALGYSVQEYSELERRYIVRERHAHAWAQLYLNGAWQDVDTTPPQWFATEAREATVFEPFTDLFSALAFAFARWQLRSEERAASAWWIVAAAGLLVILIARIYRRGGFARVQRSSATPVLDILAPEQRTALAAIEDALAASGLARHENETPVEWVRRIAPRLGLEDSRALLDVVRMHYRLRFDPHPVKDDERIAMRVAVERWITQHGARTDPP